MHRVRLSRPRRSPTRKNFSDARCAPHLRFAFSVRRSCCGHVARAPKRHPRGVGTSDARSSARAHIPPRASSFFAMTAPTEREPHAMDSAAVDRAALTAFLSGPAKGVALEPSGQHQHHSRGDADDVRRRRWGVGATVERASTRPAAPATPPTPAGASGLVPAGSPAALRTSPPSSRTPPAPTKARAASRASTPPWAPRRARTASRVPASATRSTPSSLEASASTPPPWKIPARSTADTTRARQPPEGACTDPSGAPWRTRDSPSNPARPRAREEHVRGRTRRRILARRHHRVRVRLRRVPPGVRVRPRARRVEIRGTGETIARRANPRGNRRARGRGCARGRPPECRPEC